MKHLALLVVLASILAPVPAAAQRVAIYVGPLARDGFIDVDNGVQESIRDIQKELRKSAALLVVATPSDAKIVLSVVGRRVSGSGGAIGIPVAGTGMTYMAPLDRRAIESVLRVGTYEKTLVSEGGEGAGWGSAAKTVAKDVIAWLDANRAALARQ